MLCPKCNANLKDDSTYCVRCGATFNEKKEIVSDPDESKVSFDELIKLYVGKNYDKFEDIPFSIWQLLFGPFYSFYRKYFSYGLLTLIVNIVCTELLSLGFKFLIGIEMYKNLFKSGILVSILELIFLIAINYFLSKTYNKKYLEHAGTKVKKIMFSPKKYDAETQKKICIKKGKPSVLSIFISWGIILIAVFCIAFLVSYASEKIKYNNMQKVAENICSELNEKISQSNKLDYNDENSIKIEKYTNNKYYGFFYFNENEKIVLLNALYNDILCNGTCGENVVCKINSVAKYFYK